TLFNALSDTDKKKNRLFAHISVLLQRCRKEKDLDQSDLAKKLGVSQPSISKLESGDANVSIGKLVETFDALGYDVEFSVKPQNASGAKIEVSGSNVISFLPPIYIMKWDDNWNNNQKLEVN
ncbi:MAG: helix-turn-helix transcriptional regulator, partial [Firmicutes bacterium]|nr:helix-turn-helix transcriptional regulator [Bacillota bacterium]